MFTLKGNLKFININQRYLKYLHDAFPEIYYKSTDYETKPYLGILLNRDGLEYVIALSSAMEKCRCRQVSGLRELPKNGRDHKRYLCRKCIWHCETYFGSYRFEKKLPIKNNLYSVVDLNPNPAMII